MRQLAIAAIREAGEKHARDLAELAVSETGMGRVEDKFAKNVAQARGTPGVECLSPAGADWRQRPDFNEKRAPGAWWLR